jgi:hypothetical protein
MKFMVALALFKVYFLIQKLLLSIPPTTYFLHNQLNNCEQKKYERLKQNGLSPELYVQDLAIDFPEPAVVVSREPLGLELVAERLV